MSNGDSQPVPAITSTSTTTSKSVPNKTKARPTFHFLAGLASGISSAVLLQPADLLKTRVQQSPSHSLTPVLRSILTSPHPITSLWRGTLPSALRTGFGSALYFTTLNTFRQLMANTSATNKTPHSSSTSSVLPKLTPTQNLLTGATARVFAGTILMPITVIKVRYESDFYSYKSLFAATRSIYKTEGWKGFFSGFGATAVRDAPYAGLYVVFYEWSKAYLSRLMPPPAGQERGAGTGAPLINASSGIFAGITATTITNPFDAVKTRLQLFPQKYGNLLKATRLMLLEDGIKGFFDGLALRMARKAASSALAWTVYEELIRRAERRFLNEETRVVL